MLAIFFRDLHDASHPQTILAYDMNGGPLPVARGTPLRASRASSVTGWPST